MFVVDATCGYTCVTVRCRNWRLFSCVFCCVFRLHCCVSSTVPLNFDYGRGLYMLCELISYLHIYKTHMSLTLNESSAVWRFEHIDAIKICGGIIFLLRMAWVQGYLAEFNTHQTTLTCNLLDILSVHTSMHCWISSLCLACTLIARSILHSLGYIFV